VKIVGGLVLPLKILERTKMSNIKETRRDDDWKLWKSGWKYKTDAPQNRQWNKDRKKLFRKNGNGWWLLPNKRCEKKEIKDG
jgi:hypothetical protein